MPGLSRQPQWSRTYSAISTLGEARVLLFIRTQKTSSLVAHLRRDRGRGARDVDAADLAAVQLIDPGAGAHHGRVRERVDEVGGEPVDEAVAVRAA